MSATVGDHRRRKLGWTPYAWLIYLVFYIASPAFNNGTWRDWAWTLGTVAVFLPLAFVRPDGGYVVVVQVEDTSRSFSVGGLPAGTYALSYATNSAWNVQLPDATISGGQAITASLAGPGVLTISRK